MEITWLIDAVGIATFSIAGAFAAMEKKLDVFGIFIIAFVTALGGGTLRNVLTGEVHVKWMYDLSQGLIVMAGTIAALLFTNVIRNFNKTLLLFDSLGLASSQCLGIQKGITPEMHPVICVAPAP